MQAAGLDDAESEVEGVYEHNVTGWFYIYFEKKEKRTGAATVRYTISLGNAGCKP